MSPSLSFPVVTARYSRAGLSGRLATHEGVVLSPDSGWAAGPTVEGTPAGLGDALTMGTGQVTAEGRWTSTPVVSTTDPTSRPSTGTAVTTCPRPPSRRQDPLDRRG